MIASNHQMSLRTREYLGNFMELKAGIVTHFSPGSFALWMKKADVDNSDLETIQAITQGTDELVVQFELEGKQHQFSQQVWERIWNLTAPAGSKQC